MKTPKPQSLPKNLQDAIAALSSQIKDAAKAFAAAREGFRKAKAAAKRAKTGARNTRKVVKATKKRLASLQDAIIQAEKKAAKWMRKHSGKSKSGPKNSPRVAVGGAKRPVSKRVVPRRKTVPVPPPVPVAPVLAPLNSESAV